MIRHHLAPIALVAAGIVTVYIALTVFTAIAVLINQ